MAPPKKIKKLKKPYTEMKTGHRVRPYGSPIQFGGWKISETDKKKFDKNLDLIDWSK